MALLIEFATVSAAVDALEVTRDFLVQSETNIQRLRWAVVGGHQATQAFMVAALAGSDGTGALTRSGRQAKAVREYKKALWGRQYPPPSQPENALASFRELYAFLQDDSEGSYMRRYVDAHAFSPGPDDSERMHRLNDLRNFFIHFEPSGWLIDPAYAIEALLGGYSVMSFIIEECALIPWYPPDLKASVTGLLGEVSDSLDRLCSQRAVDR